MKIIELLNRIANDDGIPIKIKFKGKEYEWSHEFCDYRCIDINHKYLVEELETEDLNRSCEEIPLIEEDKKIEKFKDYIPMGLTSVGADFRKQDVFDSLMKIGNKINEIIDYINKEKE